jgi:flotillin
MATEMLHLENFMAIAVSAGALFVFITIVFLASCYKRCPSNKILAVYGKVGKNQSVRCLHGGGAFIFPLIQDYGYLDLTPMTIHIPLKNALSFQNIRINVPSTFTVAIDTMKESMNNAAIRLLGLTKNSIEIMATEIIIGQLRLTVASLRIEEINQDRERFLQLIRSHIEPELNKIGLMLINVNITDITDEAHYIESIGQKGASTAVNQAKIDVAEQNKRGEIGRAESEREQRIQIARYNSESVKGENDALANIADTNAALRKKEAETKRLSEVAQQEAIAGINEAKALAEKKRLEAEEVIPKEIEKRKVEIDAGAVAQRQRIEAEGQANAILAIKQAEATGIKKVLFAKADGYKELVKACGEDSQAAVTMLMVEKLEHIAKLQAEAIKNIKIDKVTVWDSGSHEGKSSSTSDFMKNIVKSLPPLHDVAAMSGIKLPEYLGHIQGATDKEKNQAHAAQGAVKAKDKART